MIFSRFCTSATLLLCLFVPIASAAPKAKPARPAANSATGGYKGSVVMDAATGRVLFEDNADAISPPASMTKLMTFAVLQDRIRSGTLTLETPVTITAADAGIGGTQVWLKEKETFPVEELIYAMMIQSANDAAFALARTAAGSASAFVELMNAKASELGLEHTTFRTPHGLPPANRRIDEGDLTSPRDFAILCRHLLLKTDVVKYTSIKTRPFGGPTRAAPVVMNNHNHLLGKVPGLDGLKTGFTNSAGFCLAATAQRNHRRVIVVIMGSPDSTTRNLKVAEYIEQGFAALPPESPSFAGEGSADVDSPIASTRTVPLPSGPEGGKAAAPDDPAPFVKFSVPSQKK